MRAYNFAISGSNLTKLYRSTCREASVVGCIQPFSRGAPTKFGRAKKVQGARREVGVIIWVYRST